MTNIEKLHEQSTIARNATELRNQLILDLRLAGYKWAVIAEASGLSVNACEKIAKRMNGGSAPVPRKRVKFDRE